MNENLKIGIITILKVNNYGAELQAFALQKKIELLGFNAEIIDYLYYKNKKHRKEKISRPFVKIGLIKSLKEYFYPIKTVIKEFRSRKYVNRRNYRFKLFHDTYTRLSPKTFFSYSELYDAKLDYDVYMVGSDQVWNPFTNTSLSPYFLTFAPEGKLKISYASSFGVSIIPNDVIDKYQRFLSEFDYLSVRENKGVEIIRNISGKNALQVLDPTLLLTQEDWDKYAAKIEKLPSGYVLIYDLKESNYLTDLAKYIAKCLDCQIVRICKAAIPEDKPDELMINIVDAGPSEFLGIFGAANFVVTNSFHGTAFAINYNKKFYSVISSKKDNNSRIESLVNLLYLQDCLVHEGDDFEKLKNINIDYALVSKLLDEEKDKSVQFLLSSINNKYQ